MTKEFVIGLAPSFSLMSLSGILEPLRLANAIADSRLYDWRLIAQNGANEVSTCGVPIPATGSYQRIESKSNFLTIGCFNDPKIDSLVADMVRGFWRKGCIVGGIGAGVYNLARAKLLEGTKFTIHWNLRPAFCEEFWYLNPENTRFCIDRRILSSAGGAATTDLMLRMIEADHGSDFCLDVADMCIRDVFEHYPEGQKISTANRFNTKHKRLLPILEDIRRNLEEEISITELCEKHNISRRQIERLFLQSTGMSPAKFIKFSRLERSRNLLTQTNLQVNEVAVAVGFSSAANFSVSFKKQFGETPHHYWKNRRNVLPCV